MSVILTGVEIPKSCMDCPLTFLDTGDDAYFGKNVYRCVIDGCAIDISCYERAYGCPLKSLDEAKKEIDEKTECLQNGGLYIRNFDVKMILHKALNRGECENDEQTRSN